MSYPDTPARHLRPVDMPPDTVHEPPPAETVSGHGHARRVRLSSAAGVRLRPTHWLWDERMPHGALTIGPGREGIGKSLFCAWLAARVTLGELSGVYHGAPKSVIYAATEDSWERTLAGRLVVAGADMHRVYRVEVENVAGHTLPLSLPRDCDELAAEITAHDVGLMIVDPLISVVDSKLNPNQDADLRRALEPLGTLADETGCAIFGLAHFNKATGTDVLSRIMGGRAFSAVSRAAMAFARDTGADDGSCVISQVKNNLGRLDVPSLRYQVESVELDTDEGPAEWGRLRMLGETTTHVNDLLDDTSGSTDDRDEREEAQRWITDYLADQGGSAPSTDVYNAGAKFGGYSRDQLKRAKKDAGIDATKVGHAWYWRLPEEQSREREGSKGALPP